MELMAGLICSARAIAVANTSIALAALADETGERDVVLSAIFFELHGLPDLQSQSGHKISKEHNWIRGDDSLSRPRSPRPASRTPPAFPSRACDHNSR